MLINKLNHLIIMIM